MTDYKKLYEDAIFRMNKWVEGSEIIDPKEVAEFVFPELKESEDEKIRKAILELVKQSSHILNPMNQKSMIAWLEKQGEKLPVGFYYVNSEGKKFYSDTFKCGDFTFHVEKQDEQKHAWSEEDEKILQNLINDTEKTLFDIKQEERPDIMSGLSEIYIERLRWLKSLKDRI